MSRLHVPRMANRWRLTMWVLAAVVAVAAVSGVVAVHTVETKFTERLDEDLRDQSRGVVAAADVIDLDALAEIADRSGFGDNEHVIVLLGPGGVDLAVPSGSADDPDPLPTVEGIGADELRARAGQPFSVSSAGGEVDYRALATQLDDGRILVMASPLTGLHDAVATVVRVLLVASLVSGVVLAVTIAAVSASVTRPLDAMIDTAEAVGSGAAVGSDDLRARLPTDGVEDVARLAGALNAMLDRLERAFADREASEEALRRFVADASHELRTPLAAVLGYTELHRTGVARGPDEVDRAMERIAAEGERMRMLVEELLLLARLDEGRPRDDAPVDLATLAEVAVGDARAIAPDRPITISIPGADAPGGGIGPGHGESPSADGVVVVGDAMSLRQAIDNLLANARIHTPPGTAVTVSVMPDPVAGAVVVSVADEGPGMAPDDAAHAFERFFRAERSRARPGGSGLGLAIVAAVVEAHHGRVELTTEPGRGTEVTLTLPVAPPPFHRSVS